MKEGLEMSLERDYDQRDYDPLQSTGDSEQDCLTPTPSYTNPLRPAQQQELQTQTRAPNLRVTLGRLAAC